MDDDAQEPEELTCRGSAEGQGTYVSVEWSRQLPVARRAARENAPPGALEKALEFADQRDRRGD